MSTMIGKQRRKRSFFLEILASATVISGVLCAATAAEPEDIRLRYQAHWGGFHIANVDLLFSSDEAAFKSRLQIETMGLIRALWKWRSVGESVGSMRTGLPAPLTYWRMYSDSSSSSTTRVETDANGTASGTVDGEQDVETPLSLRLGTFDPLSGFMLAQKRILRGEKSIDVDVYDGKRRYRLKSRVGTRTTRRILEVRHDVLPVIMTMEPIMGFKERQRRLWDDNEMEVFLTPRSLVPLQILVDSRMGATAINLVSACPSISNVPCQPMATADAGQPAPQPSSVALP